MRAHPDLDGEVHQVWVSRREAGIGLTLDDAHLMAGALGLRLSVTLTPIGSVDLAAVSGELDKDARRTLEAVVRTFHLLSEPERELLDLIAGRKIGQLDAVEKRRA